MQLPDLGGHIPPLPLNLVRRYDESRVVVHQRDHNLSIKDQTHHLIQELGGVGKVVRPGDSVLIKVNASHPRTVPEGAVADPQVSYAVIEECKKAGAARICLADATSEDDGTLEVFRDLGYKPIVDKTGAELIDLNQPPYIRVDVPANNGLLYKSYIFSEQLRQFDVLISVAKMKTHSAAQVTLGMKNLVGVPPRDPFMGAGRVLYHTDVDLNQAAQQLGPKQGFEEYVTNLQAPSTNQKPKVDERICKAIVDLNLILPISMVVIDGTIGMEGAGPWKGTAKISNVLLAGYNPLSTDAVGAYIMGFDPETIRQFQLAGEKGIGRLNIQEISIAGESIEALQQHFEPATV